MIITRLRRQQTGVDRYNKPSYAELPTNLDVIGWAPQVSAESNGVEVQTLEYGGTIYLHPNSDVADDDAFIVYGVRYEADGPKALWKHPNGRYPGDVLIVKRKEFSDG